MNEKGNIENVKKKHCTKVNVPGQVCFKILSYVEVLIIITLGYIETVVTHKRKERMRRIL